MTLRRKIKTAFDIISASLGLIVLLPLFLVVAILIKVTSKGPVFYKAERIGRNHKPFKMLKFRSMVVGADKNGVNSTSDNDLRITGIGFVLRKSKIDELPQLLNVLYGDMSVVGPRPEVAKIVKKYSSVEQEVLQVKPGLIDYGSLWNSDEGRILASSKTPDEDYSKYILPTKLELSREYVRTHNLLIDCKILFAYFLSRICGIEITWALPVSAVRVPDYNEISRKISDSEI